MGFGDREEALEVDVAESERPLYGEGGWYVVYFMSRYEHDHAAEFEYTDNPNDWIGVAVTIRDDDPDWYQEDIGDHEHNWEFEAAEAKSSASYGEWDAEDRDYSEFYEDDNNDPPSWLAFDMDAFDQFGPWWFGVYLNWMEPEWGCNREEALKVTWWEIEDEYVYWPWLRHR